jgi:hypothetical protein
MMGNAPAQQDASGHYQWQNAKPHYFFLHNFPQFGWSGQPWFSGIPADGCGQYILGGRRGRMGRFATRGRGEVSLLRFSGAALFSVYAVIRVSLRKVREKQRNTRPFQRLEGR